MFHRRSDPPPLFQTPGRETGGFSFVPTKLVATAKRSKPRGRSTWSTWRASAARSAARRGGVRDGSPKGRDRAAGSMRSTRARSRRETPGRNVEVTLAIAAQHRQPACSCCRTSPRETSRGCSRQRGPCGLLRVGRLGERAAQPPLSRDASAAGKAQERVPALCPRRRRSRRSTRPDNVTCPGVARSGVTSFKPRCCR